jgi:hypothetical protein
VADVSISLVFALLLVVGVAALGVGLLVALTMLVLHSVRDARAAGRVQG